MKKTLLLTYIIFLIGLKNIEAQTPEALIETPVPSNSCSNLSVQFNGYATASAIGTSFTFDGGTLPSGWSSTAYSVGQPCYDATGDTPDHSNYFWASDVSGARYVKTNNLDVSLGGSIQFLLRFGDDDPEPGCEHADNGEGVYLQYSTNNGSTWNNIQYYDPGSYYRWTSLSMDIPEAAKTTSTTFRWIQTTSSGVGFDNWGLEDVVVTVLQDVPIDSYSWDFGDGTTATTQNATHSYAASGTYNVTFTITAGGATDVETLTYTILPNGVPTFNNISDVVIPMNGSQNVTFSGINDGDACLTQTISVSATSSNASLLPSPTVSYTSQNSSGTLNLNPVSNSVGNSTVTVTIDDNGTYTGGVSSKKTAQKTFNVYVNDIPTDPGAFTSPTDNKLNIDYNYDIAWGSSTDQTAIVTYYLEYSRNSGAWTTIASGTSSTSFSSWGGHRSDSYIGQSVQFRVRSYDGTYYSGYTYSPTFTIIENSPPVAVNDGPYGANTGGTGSGNVLSNDTDLDGDDLDVVTVPTLTHGSFSSFNLETGAFVYSAPTNWVGSFSFNYSVTDGIAQDIGTATISVADTIVPVVLTADKTLYLDASGAATIATADINNGSTDNIGIIGLALDVSSFDCSNVGTNTITLTASDAAGNFNSATAEVTVVDTVSPVAACKPVTIYLDEFGQGTISKDSIDNGSSDACGILSFDTDTTSFDCSDVSETNPVILTVTDVNNNVSTCKTEVTVIDTVSPVAVCKPVTVYLDEFGQGTIAEDSIDNGSSDACGILSFDTDTTSFDCSDVSETNPVTLTVTDANGNWSTCSTEVTVIDTVSPAALCKPVTVYLDELGQGSIAEDSIDNGSTDACGILSIETDVTSFSCSDVSESNIVELTVTDVNGNSSTCSSEVTVIDTVVPVVYCKDTILYLGEDGVEYLGSSDLDIGSSDACGIASVELSQSKFVGVDVGVNQIEMTVTDVNGNSSVCISTVTVRDTIDPEVSCKSFGIVLDEDGFTHIYPDFAVKDYYDAGGIASSFVDKIRFSCYNLGENTVTVTVQDYGGNTASCISTFTIFDGHGPDVLCKDLEVSLNAQGLAVVEPEMVDAGSSDVCGIASMSLSQSEFTRADMGKNDVTFYVTDVGGNTDSCTTTITVNDKKAPKVTCNEIEIELMSGSYMLTGEDISALAAGSSDNATPFDSLIIEANPSVFTCEQIGDSVNVEVSVIDDAGNSSTCETKVYVGFILETEVADVEVSLDSGRCETAIDYPAIFTEESCANLTLIDGLGADGIFPAGITEETWEVVLGGESDTVSFNVIVSSENLMPTLNATADTTVMEDEMFVVELTGIGDGGDCIAQDLEVSAESLNKELIETIEVYYEAGSSVAELSIAFVANQSGVAEVVVAVEDEAGATVTDTFMVTVEAKNDAPILLAAIPDTSVMATYTLDLSISKTLGVLFDDTDDDNLVISVEPIDGVLPDWILITEDESMLNVECTPVVADTGCYEFVVSATDTSGATVADTFAVCVQPLPVGIGDFSQSIFEVAMYPNPSKGLVNIEIESASFGETEISVSNVAGAEVFRRNYVSGEKIQFDLSDNVSGIYLIRISQEGKHVIKKLVLDKN
ncbi:T9SS type A sorting domain-containing protein [uncultured Draconibacterium sp.]|uniref:T9SS type A sorting domain-containing protein n=1 Tax=uncultured Draconibacterium sp. TaxID=1573823 RepID=UPI002AA6A1F7|nr:T9SS type A sorting domain-containing protein [uncultured Draconibacterium sp.]